MFAGCVDRELITNESIYEEKEVFYALINNKSKPQIYYDKTKSVWQLQNSDFHKFSSGFLKINDQNYAIIDTSRDVNQRIYNTTNEVLKINAKERIIFEKDGSRGECVMPATVAFEVTSLSVIEDKRSYIFKASINISSPFSDINNLVFDATFNAKSGRKYFLLASIDNVDSKQGIDFSKFDIVFYKEDLGFIISPFEVTMVLNKQYGENGVSNVNDRFADGLNFTGEEIELEISNFDDNFREYNEGKIRNASGAQNPLSNFEEPFSNIINAYGFIGCYSSNSFKAQVR